MRTLGRESLVVMCVASQIVGSTIPLRADPSEECVIWEDWQRVVGATGQAKTVYYGIKILDVAYVKDQKRNEEWYALDDKTRNLCTLVISDREDFGTASCLTSDDDFFDPESDKDFRDRPGSKIGLDLHWAAGQAYDYFAERHSWNGISGDGAPVRLAVAFSGADYTDNMVYALQPVLGTMILHGLKVDQPYFAVRDVVAHEYAHGVVRAMIGDPDAAGGGEPQAVEEALADIFGVLAEAHSRGRGVDWTMGEDTGRVLRSLSNPRSLGGADTYKGHGYPSASIDEGDVYARAGVGNHWFYLLTVGGGGTNDYGDSYDVSGLGVEKTEQIVFAAVRDYLPPSPTFADLRAASITAAANLHGACSEEEEQVAKAWYAVGVGPELIPGFEAKLAFSGARRTGEVLLGSDQSQINPQRALQAVGEARQGRTTSSPSTQRDLQNFAKNLRITQGAKVDDEIIPRTTLQYSNLLEAERLIIVSPSHSTGSFLKPRPVLTRHNAIENSEERDGVDVSYVQGGFEGMFTFWDTGTVNVDVFDLECAISGRFSMDDGEGTRMTGRFRFRVDEYFDRRTEQMVQPREN